MGAFEKDSSNRIRLIMRILPATPDVNCCDLKQLLGDTIRIGSSGGQCVVSTRPAYRSSVTPCQQQRRVLYRQVPELWRSLTQLQKEAWSDFASITPLFNACGDTYFDLGYRWFVRINATLLSIDPSHMIINPPANYTPPADDISLTFKYVDFCFYPRKILVVEFDPPPGQGIEVFALMGASQSEASIRKNGNLLFATDQDQEPLYGDPPDPGIDPAVLPMWALAIRSAWKKFRKGKAIPCATPRLGT